jgi:transposase-like protein
MEIGQVPAYKRWSNRYSYAFKMEVIEAFQSGQMSQRQVVRKYGVHRKTIVDWEKRYGNPEKNYLRMEEKTPQQELAELRAALCKLFGISRQGYYKKIQTYCRNKEKRTKIIQLVKQQRELMTRVGTKKTYHLIKPHLARLDIKCGRDKLHDILRNEGMLIKKKKNYMRTANSYHRYYSILTSLKTFLLIVLSKFGHQT